MIMAHHGYGEELLPALIATGGTTVSLAVVVGRAKLAEMARWLRRR
jgi:hypothetical protein